MVKYSKKKKNQITVVAEIHSIPLEHTPIAPIINCVETQPVAVDCIHSCSNLGLNRNDINSIIVEQQQSLSSIVGRQQSTILESVNSIQTESSSTFNLERKASDGVGEQNRKFIGESLFNSSLRLESTRFLKRNN